MEPAPPKIVEYGNLHANELKTCKHVAEQNKKLRVGVQYGFIYNVYVVVNFLSQVIFIFLLFQLH